MREFLELGKNLLLLLVVFLVIVFVVGQTKLAQSTDTRESRTGPINFPSQTALVTRIVDGDSIIIEGGKSVRLLGLDADERDEVCFEAAKSRLKELVLNKSVELQRELRDGDIYGRLLRYIFLDGKNVDLELVQEGLAVARASYEGGIYDRQFADAEYMARQARLGCKWLINK